MIPTLHLVDAQPALDTGTSCKSQHATFLDEEDTTDLDEAVREIVDNFDPTDHQLPAFVRDEVGALP